MDRAQPLWRTIRHLSLSALTAFGMLVAVGNSHAATTLTVQKPTFHPDSGANDAVKAECELPQKLATFIGENAKGTFDEVRLSDSPVAGTRNLVVVISQVAGFGGGAWSGPKSVQVTGKLMEGDKVVGSFTGRRSSGGGAFGGFKGTCAIMGRCVKALGSDIGKWLKNPSMDAKLGEM
jgi:hypothetical protein